MYLLAFHFQSNIERESVLCGKFVMFEKNGLVHILNLEVLASTQIMFQWNDSSIILRWKDSTNPFNCSNSIAYILSFYEFFMYRMY